MGVARTLYENLSWREFERFWAEFWARGGWRVQLTPKTHDRGFDIEVENPSTGAKYRMDVKLYEGSLWEETLRDLHEKYQRQNSDSHIPLAFLTTGGYTERATRYATKNNITIKSRDYIERVVSTSSPLYRAAVRNLPLYPEEKKRIRRRLLVYNKTVSDDALTYVHSHPATHRFLRKLEIEHAEAVVDVSTARHFDPNRTAESLPTRPYPVTQLRNY